MIVHAPGERSETYLRRQEDEAQRARWHDDGERFVEYLPDRSPTPSGPVHGCATEADALLDRIEEWTLTLGRYYGGTLHPLDGSPSVTVSRDPAVVTGAELARIQEQITAAYRRLHAIEEA